MSVRVQVGGWVSHEAVGDVLLKIGDEYPEDHPIVIDRPELFSDPEKRPARKAAAEK